MRVLKLNTTSYVLNITEHKEFKEYMLGYISKQPCTPLVECNDDITNTDWQNSQDHNREYVKKFKNILNPYLTKITKALYAETFYVNNMWYQQYANNSKHQWHRHTECNWSAVYYLELPSNDVATQLFDIPNNKIVHEKNIKEGDLFLFPSNILHRSPPNLTNNIKSIISFNLDFDGTI